MTGKKEHAQEETEFRHDPANILEVRDLKKHFLIRKEWKFVKESVEAGFTNLKGHRSVGGMRASIYNAMPTEGVEKLCDFIKAFDKNN